MSKYPTNISGQAQKFTSDLPQGPSGGQASKGGTGL